MISAGISRVGGKYRLRKELLERTPYHEFFLSPFCGGCWFEINKPRCRYECFNDVDGELINYLLQIRTHPKEFDKLKQGVFGLVSQEICNRIINGTLQPRNDLERAYFFYYLNKLTFGGSIKKGTSGIINPRAIPQNTLHKEDFDEIKVHYKGLQGSNHQVREADMEKAKANYRSIMIPTSSGKVIEDAKASYRGMTIPNEGNERLNDQNIEKAKANYKKESSYKGINPKTTRPPFSNNDCGLLTPLDPKAIKRLRYVNLTAYDFRKVYDLFHAAFHERKELGPECLIYTDPPYPGTESYYSSEFGEQEHEDLVERMLKSPFHWMHSVGGECEELYIDLLKETGWLIDTVKTKYSTDANSQNEIQEYICMNYDIEKLPKMIYADNQLTLKKFLEI